MATIYKRKGSPYFWIKYQKLDSIKPVQESTGLRWDSPLEVKQAKRLCAEKSLIELKEKDFTGGHRFIDWVPTFLKERYHQSNRTFATTFHRWQAMQKYLAGEGIYSPRQVTYKTALSYLQWRQDSGASRNTAIHEIKLLSLIMNEAVKRDFVQVNPCMRMGLKRDKPKEKPEFTNDQIKNIREELSRIDEKGKRVWPEWMTIAFEIGIHQGCRIREVSVNFRDIDFKRKTITFDAKGSNRFTTTLHPDLAPILKKVKDSGAKVTCELPRWPSKWFQMLFEKLGMRDGKRDYCFHCCRVTVITRLARSQNVSMSQAMRFVSHSSHTVHRIYQRLGVEDLASCVEAISLTCNQKD